MTFKPELVAMKVNKELAEQVKPKIQIDTVLDQFAMDQQKR